MSTLPLETRKRILTGLGYSVREDRVNGHVCYQLLKDGKNANFTARPNAEQAAWESVEIDANFCEREVIPYLRQRNQSVVIAIHNGTGGRYRVAIDREEHEHHVYLGDESSSTKVDFAVTRDSLSTAIALVFDAYLQAQTPFPNTGETA